MGHTLHPYAILFSADRDWKNSTENCRYKNIKKKVTQMFCEFFIITITL